MYNSELLLPSFPRDVCYEMLRITTNNVQLNINNLMFRQTDGVRDGKPFSPILTNIFAGYYENSFPSSDRVKPSYCKHVDDVFDIFHSKNYVNVLQI